MSGVEVAMTKMTAEEPTRVWSAAELKEAFRRARWSSAKMRAAVASMEAEEKWLQAATVRP